MLALSYFEQAHKEFDKRHEQASKEGYNKACNNAIAILVKAIESNATLAAEAFYYCGMIYETMYELTRAITCYSKSIVLNSNELAPYFRRAVLYQSLKYFKEAIDDFMMFLEFLPDDAPSYNNLGLAYEILHEKKRALYLYNEAISLNSNEPAFYCNRGSVYQTLNECKKAEEDFTEAIKLYEKQMIDVLASQLKNYEDKDSNMYITQEQKVQEESDDSYQKIKILFNRANMYEQIVGKIKSQLALVYFKRSIAHYYQDNIFAAKTDFNVAVSYDPELEYASIKGSLKRNDENEIPLVKKLKKNPEHTDQHLHSHATTINSVYQTQSSMKIR